MKNGCKKKPTEGIDAGSTFIELDTGSIFVYNGVDTWHEM